ncbi:MAG: hypothetical protein H6528_06615 [Actinobacteria bacterium]|nr:hypothetical protein [Actinomycetota bacterium]
MIAGKTNGTGVAGLAPNARILPVKVLDGRAWGTPPTSRGESSGPLTTVRT